MFENRKDAGEKLVNRLQNYKNRQNTIVVGLPRGGVVVAFEVAQKLQLPLDIVATRKISMPGNPEAAIGAVTPDGNKVFDQDFISEVEIEQDYLDNEIAKEIKEAKRRIKVYRENRKPLNLAGKTVLVIDDGVATGSTIRAAVKSIRSQDAKKIVIAVPVAPREFLKKIASEVDEIVCLETPPYFVAVGEVYKDSTQTSDDEVVRLMRKSVSENRQVARL
jgi:predicted phosphoribosyltransferase